eukprot:TRINITY_DN1885_c0_g3_i2.p1 TRINITY_DN1885_c0_g3~~TRINITY_DN1885_c0_g3_i2.p1  ORF type:complete len:621 (+),score=153.02 TRINITY_DN1885_c0_g3_i2:112-1863(+)
MGGSIRAARVTPADEYSKSCVIEGPPDSGISVSFPVTKCLKECNRAVPWKEVGNGAMQITKQFSLLFTTQIEGNHCVCSDKRGAKLVKYKLSKKMKKQCSRNSDKAKMECWNTYKMTRAATLDFSGSSPVVKINYQKSKDDTFTFITNSNRCFDCEGESCRSFSLPSPIASMSKREREAIAGVGPQMKTGGLKTFMDALVTDATSGLVGGSFASENAESEPESDADGMDESASSSGSYATGVEEAEAAVEDEPGSGDAFEAEAAEVAENAPDGEAEEAQRDVDVEAEGDGAEDTTGEKASVDGEEEKETEDKVEEDEDDEGEKAEEKREDSQDEQEEQKDEWKDPCDFQEESSAGGDSSADAPGPKESAGVPEESSAEGDSSADAAESESSSSPAGPKESGGVPEPEESSAGGDTSADSPGPEESDGVPEESSAGGDSAAGAPEPESSSSSSSEPEEAASPEAASSSEPEKAASPEASKVEPEKEEFSESFITQYFELGRHVRRGVCNDKERVCGAKDDMRKLYRKAILAVHPDRNGCKNERDVRNQEGDEALSKICDRWVARFAMVQKSWDGWSSVLTACSC